MISFMLSLMLIGGIFSIVIAWLLFEYKVINCSSDMKRPPSSLCVIILTLAAVGVALLTIFICSVAPPCLISYMVNSYPTRLMFLGTLIVIGGSLLDLFLKEIKLKRALKTGAKQNISLCRDA